MTHKRTKAPSTKIAKFENAFKDAQWTTRLDLLQPEELFTFKHDLGEFFSWWMGDPTAEIILELWRSLPLLNQLLDVNIVLKRLESLESFERGLFGVRLGTFLPEIREVYKACGARIAALPSGVYKAECWLTPIGRQAGANSDVEAAVYLASRGVENPINVDALRDTWYYYVCRDIERGNPVGKVPQAILKRAHSRTISLAEAAQVLTAHEYLPGFFAFRDEEEDFIDAAMFRAVEWLGITGFDPWLKSLISTISLGPREGIGEASAVAWWLFFWCRSDLALRMVDRQGLESWLWSLVNGQDERDTPWRLTWRHDKAPRKRDYIPLAGIILFLWNRIKPHNMNGDILRRATELLYQTQMRCGGWPLYMDDSEPDLISTCFSIHGLALHRPEGWEQLASRAAEWVEKQQQPEGCYYIQGGPTVMLTVLALDALVLARNGKELTFKLDSGNESVNEYTGTRQSTANQRSNADPIYHYENEKWFQPKAATTLSVPWSRARKMTKPKLAIVVATETELRQTLRVLRSMPKQHRIWKVVHDHDTYYLGRFGAFKTVVTLSSMGSEGVTGSTLSVQEVIRMWNPKAVILLGIAFGASRSKHGPADVLIAEHLIPFERQRVGDVLVPRNPIPPSSPMLVNRFRNALGWTFRRPDGTECAKHVGSILSGEKLIDNQDFKSNLLDQYPDAIGGEMEGAGLWAAADRERKEWIIVKGVCDWADGHKHNSYQAMAAASAVSLCEHVFSDQHALDGV